MKGKNPSGENKKKTKCGQSKVVVAEKEIVITIAKNQHQAKNKWKKTRI